MTDDGLLSTSFHESSWLDINNDNQDIFAAIRESLDKIKCSCGGLRRVIRRFKTLEQARLAHAMLLSEHHHQLEVLLRSRGLLQNTLSA